MLLRRCPTRGAASLVRTSAPYDGGGGGSGGGGGGYPMYDQQHQFVRYEDLRVRPKDSLRVLSRKLSVMEGLVADSAYLPSNLVVAVLNHVRGMPGSEDISRRAIGLTEEAGITLNGWSLKASIMSLACSKDREGVLAMERKIMHFPDTLSDPHLLSKLLHAHVLLGATPYALALYHTLQVAAGEQCTTPGHTILRELLYSMEEPIMFVMPPRFLDRSGGGGSTQHHHQLAYRTEKEAAMLAAKLRACAFSHALLHHFTLSTPPSHGECRAMLYHFTREVDKSWEGGPGRFSAVTAAAAAAAAAASASASSSSFSTSAAISGGEGSGDEDGEGASSRLAAAAQPTPLEFDKAVWAPCLLRMLSLAPFTAALTPPTMALAVEGVLSGAGLSRGATMTMRRQHRQQQPQRQLWQQQQQFEQSELRGMAPSGGEVEAEHTLNLYLEAWGLNTEATLAKVFGMGWAGGGGSSGSGSGSGSSGGGPSDAANPGIKQLREALTLVHRRRTSKLGNDGVDSLGLMAARGAAPWATLEDIRDGCVVAVGWGVSPTPPLSWLSDEGVEEVLGLREREVMGEWEGLGLASAAEVEAEGLAVAAAAAAASASAAVGAGSGAAGGGATTGGDQGVVFHTPQALETLGHLQQKTSVLNSLFLPSGGGVLSGGMGGNGSGSGGGSVDSGVGSNNLMSGGGSGGGRGWGFAPSSAPTPFFAPLKLQPKKDLRGGGPGSSSLPRDAEDGGEGEGEPLGDAPAGESGGRSPPHSSISHAHTHRILHTPVGFGTVSTHEFSASWHQVSGLCPSQWAETVLRVGVGGYLQALKACAAEGAVAEEGDGASSSGNGSNNLLPSSLHNSVLAALLHRGRLGAGLQVCALVAWGRRKGCWKSGIAPALCEELLERVRCEGGVARDDPQEDQHWAGVVARVRDCMEEE